MPPQQKCYTRCAAEFGDADPLGELPDLSCTVTASVYHSYIDCERELGRCIAEQWFPGCFDSERFAPAFYRCVQTCLRGLADTYCQRIISLPKPVVKDTPDFGFIFKPTPTPIPPNMPEPPAQRVQPEQSPQMTPFPGSFAPYPGMPPM